MSLRSRLCSFLSGFLIATAALALTPPAALAVEYFVSTTGSNANAGTRSAPYATIAYGVGKLKAGDTLTVLDGNYSESVTIYGLKGTSASPITIRGEGMPKITATGRDVFLLMNGCEWLIFDGFELTGGSRAGMITNHSSNIVIRNSDIHHNYTWGIQTTLSSHITVENCELYGSADEHGIYFSTTDYPTVRNCHIYSNSRCGIHMNGDISEGGDGMITGPTIVGNRIHDNGTTGGAAINMDGGEQAFVANNLVYNNKAGGINSYSIDSAHGGSGNRYYHNTVYFAPGAGRYGLQLYASSTNAIVKNNIFICGRLAFELESAALPGLQSDNNIFIRHGSTTPIAVGASYYSLSSWQTARNLDHNSLTTMPSFVNLSGNDYDILSTSAGVDAGTPISGIAIDIQGLPRTIGAAPDMGAYEAESGTTPPPPPPTGDGTGLLGEYFNDMALSVPAITRTDPTVDFLWLRGTSPDASINDETFSVRWSGEVEPAYSETYTFYTLTDDGVKLWVNNSLLVNDWTNHSATERKGTITLTAGQKYDIVMEYYDNTADARAQLSWSSPSCAKQVIPADRLYPATATTPPPPPPTGDGTGLRGEYFNDIALSQPALTRVDPKVDFSWPHGTSPSPAVGDETFSVRWSGEILPQYTQSYTFHIVSDDGARLFVNGQSIINDWTNHSSRESTGTISLTAGQRVSIVMEYYDNAYDARAQLYWSGASTPKAIIPTACLYPAGTVTPPPTTGDGTGLTGTYFHDMALGQLAFTRVDPTVDFSWLRGTSPSASLDGETFSVRWTGSVEPLYSENYTFYTLSDDGVRLWVNGIKLVDNWTNHSSTENQGSIVLEAGVQVEIKMEYYDNTADARAKLSWSSPSQAKQAIPQKQLYPTATVPPIGGTGLRGQYFNGMTLSNLVTTRTDANVNFFWARGTSPAPGVNHDGFSVRWTGYIEPQYSETYTFHTFSDDGIKLWVDGILLINNWTNHSTTENRGVIDLSEGERIPITIEYYDNAYDARAEFHWSSPSQPREPVPTEFLFPE